MLKEKTRKYLRIVAVILILALSMQSVSAIAESVYEYNNTYHWLIEDTLTETTYSEDLFNKYQDNSFESNTSEIISYNEFGEMDYTYALSGTIGETIASLDINFRAIDTEVGNRLYKNNIDANGSESFVSQDTTSNFANSVYGLGTGWSLGMPQIEYVDSEVAYFHFADGKTYRIVKNQDDTYSLGGFPYQYIISENTQEDTEQTEGTFIGFIGTDSYGNKDFFDRNGRFIKSVDNNGNELQTVTYDINNQISSITTDGYTLDFVRTATDNGNSIEVKMTVVTNGVSETKKLYTLTVTNGKLVLVSESSETIDTTTVEIKANETTPVSLESTEKTNTENTVEYSYTETLSAVLVNSETNKISSSLDGTKFLTLSGINEDENITTEYTFTATDSTNTDAIALAEQYTELAKDYTFASDIQTDITYSKGYKDFGKQSCIRNNRLEDIVVTSVNITNDGYNPASEVNTAETETNPEDIIEGEKSFSELLYDSEGKVSEDITYSAEYDEENQKFSENIPTEKIVYDYTVSDEIKNETLAAVNETIEAAVTVTNSVYEENEETLEYTWSEAETLSAIGKNSDGEVIYTNSEDGTVYYAYNGNGNPIKEVIQDGLTSLYTYDSLGNVLLQTISDGTVSRSTRNFYDNYGRVLRKIGHEEYDETKDSLTIDSRGVCVESSYSDTLSGEHYTYDSNDNILTYINCAGNKTINIYDSENRLIKTTTYATITDAESDIGGLTTRYIYDTEGNLIQTVYPHQYDSDNDNLDVSNGINEYTDNTIGERVTYDDDGNVTEYIDSFGKKTVNTYDSQNHLVKSVTGDEITRFVYNGGDDLLQIIYPEQYNPADDNLNLTAETPVDTYSNSNVGDRYTYDENGNVLTYTNTYGDVTTNTYDDEGDLVSTTKPDGTVLTFDNENRATKETYSNGLIRDFTYTSNQTVITGSNGITATYNLNSFGEVTEYKHQNGENNKDYSYTYDSNGNITTISLNGSLQQTFTYNSSNELDRVDDAVVNKTITYEYDYVGNITSVKTYIYTTGTLGTPLTNQNYTYNSQNQRTDLSYDTNGNMTELNGFDFTWDGRRLTEAISLDKNISYTYNSNGIRTIKTINGITTYYEVGDNNNVVKQCELVNDVETNVIEFVYDSNNTPIYFTYNNATYYYEKNMQGDIIAILDANGNTVVEYTYDIWGKLLGITGELADTLGVVNPLRYRGYYYDTETQLYYLQSRYYSPDLMRFISQDDAVYSNTQGQPLGSNLYAYCLNNPVMNSDPSGSQPNWAEAISKYAKGTLAYKTFLYATQKGWFSSLFWKAGFFRTRDGVYHTRQDCWQQFFGYNNFYDWAFNLGTSMSRAKFPFYSGNKEYIFWAWKGDYLNLGAGAELGLYSRLILQNKKTGHWIAETKLAMKMSMKLKYKGKTIATYKPTQKQWWITCFNPYYQSVKSKQLTVSFTVNFTNKKMFNDFYNKYGIGKYKDKRWSFDKKNHQATFTF